MPSEYVPPQQLTPNGPVHGGFVFHEEPSQVNAEHFTTAGSPVPAGAVLDPKKRYVDSFGDVWTYSDNAWRYGNNGYCSPSYRVTKVGAHLSAYLREIREPGTTQVNRDPLFVAIMGLNRWLDDAQIERDADPGGTECTAGEDSLMRVLKVTEEAGEVAAAYIGWTGQNPRKGVTHDLSDVISELCDVALTALAAVEHFTAGGRTCTEALFREHVEKVRRRALEPNPVLTAALCALCSMPASHDQHRTPGQKTHPFTAV